MAQKQALKQKEKTEQKTALPRAKEVRERILELSKGIESGYVDLSQLVYEALHQEYFKGWGYDSFDDYCSKELDVDYRKMRYLVDIWDKVATLDLPKAQIAQLGWTKMKDIALVITKKNAKKLLTDALKMSSRELTESVKVMRRTGQRGSFPKGPVTQTISFKMGESEHKIVMEALDEAKKLCESENLTVALEMICQDWLTDKGTKPESTHLEDHIKYLEKVYPVKISFKEVEKRKVKGETGKVLDEVEKGKKGKTKKEKSRVPDPDDIGDDETGGADIDELLGGGKKGKK